MCVVGAQVPAALKGGSMVSPPATPSHHDEAQCAASVVQLARAHTVLALLCGATQDLSNIAFQKWMVTTMLNFLEVTAGGGFAWDHNIFAGGAAFQYAQWRAWMAILKELRTHYPEMVMDHRQTARESGVSR